MFAAVSFYYYENCTVAYFFSAFHSYYYSYDDTANDFVYYYLGVLDEYFFSHRAARCVSSFRHKQLMIVQEILYNISSYYIVDCQ